MGITRQDDAGIGLVEVVIAMMLLSVLALALLPVLAGAARGGAADAQTVTRSAAADGALARLRASFPTGDDTTSCASLRKAVQAAAADAGLSASAGACPDDYPGVVTVTVASGTPSALTTAYAVARP